MDPAQAAAIRVLATGWPGRLADPRPFGLTGEGLDVTAHPVAHEGPGGRVHLLRDPDGQAAWAFPSAPGLGCIRLGVLTRAGAFRPTLAIGDGRGAHVGLALDWLRAAGIRAVGRRITLPRAPSALQAPPGSAEWVDASETRSRRTLRDGRVVSRMPNGEVHLFDADGTHIMSADPARSYGYSHHNQAGAAPGRSRKWSEPSRRDRHSLHNLPTDEMIALLDDVDPDGRLFRLVAIPRHEHVGFRLSPWARGTDAVGSVEDPLDFALLPLHEGKGWVPAGTAGHPFPEWEAEARILRPAEGIEIWFNWGKRPEKVDVVEAVLWTGGTGAPVVATVERDRIDVHSRGADLPRTLALLRQIEGLWEGRPARLHGPLAAALVRDGTGAWSRTEPVAEAEGFSLHRRRDLPSACTCLDASGRVAWHGFAGGTWFDEDDGEGERDRRDRLSLDLPEGDGSAWRVARLLAKRAGLRLEARRALQDA